MVSLGGFKPRISTVACGESLTGAVETSAGPFQALVRLLSSRYGVGRARLELVVIRGFCAECVGLGLHRAPSAQV